MTDFDFAAIAKQVRNWERWGQDDVRGTLNHVDGAALRRAAAEVTQGKMINLGLSFGQGGPQLPEVTGRQNPQLFAAMLNQPLNPASPRAQFNDDVVVMPTQCATQWDALSHGHYDGEMYNGCNASQVTAKGTPCHGIEHLASPGIASHGILIDIARFNGVDTLPADHRILPDELNRVCAAQGVTVEPGDIVLVRTGHLHNFLRTGDRSGVAGLQAGLAPECAEWLHDKSVAAVASDNMAVECLDMPALTGEIVLPLHMLCLRDMGMPLGELFDLERLASDCADDKRYTFMFAAPPLGIVGGFGSPVNPMIFK